MPKPPTTSPSTKLRTLYPPLAPYDNGTLAVDSLHTLAYAEFGSPDGIPALFLHGGPGAGCFSRHAQFFDPLKYRIILLDQRGSGDSTPRGEIRNNTLVHLIQDCETLRETLGVKQWGVLLGGSWGSTLAVAYAQEHPTRVQSLLLRGVCLLRPQEVDWLFGGDGDTAGVSAELHCEEAWRKFQAAVGIVDDEKEPLRRQSLHAYYDRLLSNDSAVQLAAAGSWSRWESSVSSAAQRESNDSHVVLVGRSSEAGTRVWGFRNEQGDLVLPQVSEQSPLKYKESLRKNLMLPSVSAKQDTMRPIHPVVDVVSSNESSSQFNASQWAGYVPAQAMLTCFYSVNDRYAMNNMNLLDRVNRIRHIPCIAVHGGSDSICPVDSALDLCKVYPNMELRISLGSGHSMYDPSITHELVKATDRIATQLSLQVESWA
jgi:proline iminopeptidase